MWSALHVMTMQVGRNRASNLYPGAQIQPIHSTAMYYTQAISEHVKFT